MKSIVLKVAVGCMGESKEVVAIPIKETLSGFRFFTHEEVMGTDGKITVSEWRLGIHCCTDSNREKAIEKLKKIYADYGDKAFSEKIRASYGQYQALNEPPINS